MSTTPERASVTLTDFLLARIAEDETVAQEAKRDWYGHEGGLRYSETGYNTTPDLTIDPERVLAECEAKRRIIGTAPYGHNGLHLCSDEMVADHECNVLRALASIYADHPDYRDEWRA